MEMGKLKIKCLICKILKNVNVTNTSNLTHMSKLTSMAILTCMSIFWWVYVATRSYWFSTFHIKAIFNGCTLRRGHIDFQHSISKLYVESIRNHRFSGSIWQCLFCMLPEKECKMTTETFGKWRKVLWKHKQILMKKELGDF